SIRRIARREDCRVNAWNRARRSALVGLVAVALAVSGVTAQDDGEAFVPEGCWAADPSTEQGFPQWDSPPEMVIDEDTSYLAVVSTNKGDMTFELNTEAAPA